jgi:FAD:protein FMN transferase
MLNYMENTTFALGTVINLKVYGENAQAAILYAVKQINRLDDVLSVFKENSEISQINKYAGKAFIKVSPCTYELLSSAVHYSKLSGGVYDPTIKPLVDLWKAGGSGQALPQKADIRKARRMVRYSDIIFDKKQTAVKLRRPGQAIDLGGIAKGYAADYVRDILTDYGISSAVIDLGGNIYLLGDKPDQSPWRTGIQDPFSLRGEHIGILTKSNASVVTSGGYEKFSMIDGKQYHHIIDPRTGYPSESDIISATVVSPDSIDGDGLSTGLYILGLKKAVALIESIKKLEAIFITGDMQVVCTSGICNDFRLNNGNYRLSVNNKQEAL